MKVNQQRHLVEKIVRIGSPYNLGLECGSKPGIDDCFGNARKQAISSDLQRVQRSRLYRNGFVCE